MVSMNMKAKTWLLTIPDVLSLQYLETFPTLEYGFDEERNLDASFLERTLPDTMNHWWRHDGSRNRVFLLSLQKCHVDITMNMVLDWKRGDLLQIGNVRIHFG